MVTFSGFQDFYNSVEKAFYKSMKTTFDAYKREYINFLADIQAAGTRGSAISVEKFAHPIDENTSIYEMFFDSDRNIYQAERDENGKIKGMKQLKLGGIYDEAFENNGGLDLITGGVYGKEPGDRVLYKEVIEDWDFIKGVCLDISADHYFGKSKSNPEVVKGKTYYKAELPTGEYDIDLKLMIDNYSVGIAYDLLDLFFQPAKDIYLGVSKGLPGSQKIPLDPIVNTQLSLAQKVGKNSGGILMPLFPFLWILREPLKLLRQETVNTLEYATNDIVKAFIGFGQGYGDPAKAKGRSFSYPSSYEMSDGGIYTPTRISSKRNAMPRIGFRLSDTGPIDSDGIIRPDFRGTRELKLTG